MNIKEAKETVKNTVCIYTEKDNRGEYVIPRHQKRPIMLVGAPGIGKTDVMKQVAAEVDLPLLCYTMTHLTRQSLIGLPALKTAVYGGKEYAVTENTLSDMMCAILTMMERTGKDEGILFLDEVNCVSETLSATMLDLLQNKRIGNHEIPEGWVLVTAGNPPQYNKSVKEYDIATMDRLRMIYVDPSLPVWKEYAYKVGTHPAIMAFLEINEDAFYKISSSVDGKRYATARGWSDLSTALYAYERRNIPVDDSLILQYITDVDIARKFAVYYTLFRKYKMDYSIQDVLDGSAPAASVTKAADAEFDERLSVLSMLMEGIGTEARGTMTFHESLQDVVRNLRLMKKKLTEKTSVLQLLQGYAEETRAAMEKAQVANSLSPHKKEVFLTSIDLLNKYRDEVLKSGTSSNEDQFKVTKSVYTKDVKTMERRQKKLSSYLDNAYDFIGKAWGEEMEMTLFTTELTANEYTVNFLASYGSESYSKHNGELQVLDVNKKLSDEISALDQAV